jgi:hypothetical protein
MLRVWLWRSVAEKNVLFCVYCHTDFRHATRVKPVWSAFVGWRQSVGCCWGGINVNVDVDGGCVPK